MRNRTRGLVGVICAAVLQLQLAGCPAPDPLHPEPVKWPIAKSVFTTAEQQVLPVAVSADTPQIGPTDVALYGTYGYSAWQAGGGTDYGYDPENVQPYDKRTELAPSYQGAASVARLLSFFSISDVHIADKESPAQPIYMGSSAPYGPSSAGMQAAYSPILLSTTHVLDAAVQTVNALHQRTPFDFGIALGDAINNTQYNELRWYIGILDGEVITPSSGAHDGADSIDYQKPFQAVGLDPTIPWYQVVGNHDQFWMGSSYEDAKTQRAHVGSFILNMSDNPDPSGGGINGTGAYMGVIDGSTTYGNVVGAGLQQDFWMPPRVVPDSSRHSLATSKSSSLNWMKEFFNTTSAPVGHGFSQSNLDQDFACYSFEPRPDVPLKIIVLDDTCKGDGQPNYTLGALDQARLDWLTAELQEGQDHEKLMIIAAHVPIYPQQTLDPSSGNGTLFSSTSVIGDLPLLAMLHNYPNLILWIAGHRHVNVVTPQPSPDPVNHPEQGFWEVETASLRDFPQQFRTFDIRRNSDNTISIFTTDVDPAVAEGSPAYKSRGYAIGAARIFGATPASIADTTSHAYNAELVKQLSPAMQAKIASVGLPIEFSGE